MITQPELVNKRNLKEIALIVTGVLASISIGGGIIAIFAHNWDDLPFAVRLMLAFIPVVLGIGCFSLAFLNHHLSRVWMEASTVFLMLMMGSSIGLVAQVYNMGGTFENFLFTWMILTVPLIYIGRSSATALLYLTGITWWLLLTYFDGFHLFGRWGGDEEQLQWWLLFAGYVPHFLMFVKPGALTFRGLVLGWFTGFVVLYFGLASFSGHYLFNYIAIIMLVYGAGKYYYGDQRNFWSRPFQTLALVALVFCSLYFSTKGAFVHYSYYEGYVSAVWDVGGDSGLKYLNLFPFFINIFLAYYFWEKVSKSKKINYFIYFFPVVFVLGTLFGMLEWDLIARIFINLYLLCFGCYYIYQGMEKNIPGIVLTGVIIICLTLTARYFDVSISFWLKGLVYIAVGALALWFNNYYSNRLKNER